MLLEGFLLGLGTGTSCVLTCTPLILPLLCARQRGPAETARIVGLFLGGRLIAYVLAGALLALAGCYALGYVSPRLQTILGGSAYILAGTAMLVQGLHLNGHLRRQGRLCRTSSRLGAPGNAAITGFASGFSLCPPFVGAAARVFGLGSSLAVGHITAATGLTAVPAGSTVQALMGGMAYFASFFAGTSLFFLPLLGIGLIRRLPAQLHQVARMVMIMLGIYFLVFLGVFRLTGVA